MLSDVDPRFPQSPVAAKTDLTHRPLEEPSPSRAFRATETLPDRSSTTAPRPGAPVRVAGEAPGQGARPGAAPRTRAGTCFKARAPTIGDAHGRLRHAWLSQPRIRSPRRLVESRNRAVMGSGDTPESWAGLSGGAIWHSHAGSRAAPEGLPLLRRTCVPTRAGGSGRGVARPYEPVPGEVSRPAG